MSSVTFTPSSTAKRDIQETRELAQNEADTRIQSLALHYVGWIVLVLSTGGVVAFFRCPTDSKDLWTAIAPIILAAITGTLGFLAGEKSAKVRAAAK
jgi:hypothetical protein